MFAFDNPGVLILGIKVVRSQNVCPDCTDSSLKTVFGLNIATLINYLLLIIYQ